MSLDEKRRNLLGPETLIPLGAVATVIVSVVGAAIWTVGTVKDLRYGIDALTVEMRAKTTAGDERDVELRKLLEQTIRRSEFAMWTDLVRAKNPNVTLPDMPH